jgi:hypothetical protein
MGYDNIPFSKFNTKARSKHDLYLSHEFNFHVLVL